MRTFAFLLIVGCPFVIFGQPNNATIEKMIVSELDSALQGNNPVKDYHFNSSNEKHFLDFVRKYETHNNSNVRFRIQRIKVIIAMQSKDSLIRQEVVEDFVNDFSDLDQSISQYAISRLLTFQQNDFSPKAKRSMVNIFEKEKNNHDFILVCGTAQLREVMPQLKKLSANFNRTTDNWYNTTEWYATLALARMGDSEKNDNIIASVELQLNPNFRVATLLRYIAYTKQPDCIKLLQKYLESTESLPSLRETGKGIEFNQFALEYLTTYFEGFPIKHNEIGYTREEVETARAFLRKQNERYGQ